MRMEKKVIREYEMMRVVLTLLVILSHCQYFRILTPYGGVDFLHPGSGGLMMFRLLNLVCRMIYSFHMAAFIALSGALFRRSCERRPGMSFESLTVSKAKRLLIPFVTVTLFYVFPLKLAAGYWVFSPGLLRDVSVGQLLLQGLLPQVIGEEVGPGLRRHGVAGEAHENLRTEFEGAVEKRSVPVVYDVECSCYCGLHLRYPLRLSRLW